METFEMALLMVVYESRCCRGKWQGDKEMRQLCQMMWQMMWTSCLCIEFILVGTNYIVIGDMG
jgi:hypothetical protein